MYLGASMSWPFKHCEHYYDRVSSEGNAIGRVRPSVSLSVFSLNRLTFDINFCMCMGHDDSLPRLKVKVKSHGEVTVKV